MHRLSTSFVLGYHGCDRSVAVDLISGVSFRASANDYDWLGWGVYFWEANPARALEFVHELQRRREGTARAIKQPCVVGAVIDLGLCLDLTTSTGIAAVKASYQSYQEFFEVAGTDMPKNVLGSDLLLRKLDCGVINHLHELRERGGLQKLDTVRGVFAEGSDAYPGAGFKAKTHIQICVRTLASIKGVFLVTDPDAA